MMNMMNMMNVEEQVSRYQMCIDASKRVRWDIEEDIIRGRQFNVANKFLPDGLTGMQNADFLSEADQVFVSQIQGRTYTKVFGVAERFVNAKVLDISRDHWLGDQVALEALVRFSDEEIKHQALFRRIDAMIGDTLRFVGALLAIFSGYPVAFALGGVSLMFAAIAVQSATRMITTQVIDRRIRVVDRDSADGSRESTRGADMISHPKITQ